MNARTLLTALALSLPLAAVVSALVSKPAEAAKPPVELLAEAHAAQAAVGPGFVDSFTISCTSAAAVKIVAPSGSQFSYYCQNGSTTKVAVGDSGITDPGTSQTSPIFCATNCPEQVWSADVRFEYCRGDTDTTIYCRAMVGTAP